jgi:hypothetical protein
MRKGRTRSENPQYFYKPLGGSLVYQFLNNTMEVQYPRLDGAKQTG